MGAWSFVAPEIENVLDELGHKARRPRYVGRPTAASTATGLLKRHQREQALLVDQALSVD
jgi:2-oxoglutarate dehydrogenase E1 component